MTWKIRAALASDLDTIIQFNCRMAEETEGKKLDGPTVTQGVKAVLSDGSKGFYLVAEKDGKPIGQLMVTFEWSDWRNSNIWWIQSVYVLPSERRQGVYSALYREVCDLARKTGTSTIRLYVEKQNVQAMKVYEQLGMIHSIYNLYEAILPSQVSDR